MTGPVLRTRWRALDWPAGARRAATAVFFVAVNWMLLAPSDAFEDIHQFLAHQDKIAHGGIFLALAFLVRWSLPARWWRGGATSACLAALVVYAAGIETFQPLVGGQGRVFEWLDMAANFAGTLAGWALLGWVAMAPPRRESAGQEMLGEMGRAR